MLVGLYSGHQLHRLLKRKPLPFNRRVSQIHQHRLCFELFIIRARKRPSWSIFTNKSHSNVIFNKYLIKGVKILGNNGNVLTLPPTCHLQNVLNNFKSPPFFIFEKELLFLKFWTILCKFVAYFLLLNWNFFLSFLQSFINEFPPSVYFSITFSITFNNSFNYYFFIKGFCFTFFTTFSHFCNSLIRLFLF